MNVVLDTNVLVSGLLSARGTCSRVLDLLVGDVYRICVDDRILAEYEAVLHRPELGIDRHDADEVLGFIRQTALAVQPIVLPGNLPDRDDAPFLEVAVSAGAILVTGNLRHFPEESRAGAVVCTPAEFMALFR